MPSSCAGDERYSSRAAVPHTPSIVRVHILVSSLATHTHRPVLRRYANGGGRGTCAVLAHGGLTKRTERVRTYHGTHGAAAPIGYYAFSQGTRRLLGGDSTAYGNRVCMGVVRARAAARRLGYGTRTVVVGAWSVFLTTRRVLGGYSRRTHGRVRGMICAGQWKGTCGALATETHRARARNGVLRTIPSTPRRCATRGAAASVLAATCGEGTRTAVRQCVRVHAGCFRTPTGRGARTQAHGAASLAGRAHSSFSKLSADSAAGIVPSSEL